MESEDFLNPGLTPGVVGMLILNELKCFRRELVDEVTKLSKRIDKIANCYSSQSNCNTSKINDNNENISYNHFLSPLSQPNNVATSYQSQNSIQLQSSSFKELTPDNDNDIVNNHIAFRMAQSVPVPQKKFNPNINNETIKIANVQGNYMEDQLFQNELASSDKNFNNSSLGFHSNNPSPSKTAVGKSKTKEKYTVIYKCTFCTDYFTSMPLYNKHYSEVHSDAGNYTLSTKSFWDDQSGKNCFELSQPKVIYICSVCSREFSTRGSLLRHSVLHSGVKKYVCKLCGKGFFRSDHLKSHLPTHSRKKQFQCSLCLKYFSRVQNFKNHLKLHDSIPSMLNHGAMISIRDASDVHNHSQSTSSFDFASQEIDHVSAVNAENTVCIKTEIE